MLAADTLRLLAFIWSAVKSPVMLAANTLRLLAFIWSAVKSPVMLAANTLRLLAFIWSAVKSPVMLAADTLRLSAVTLVVFKVLLTIWVTALPPSPKNSIPLVPSFIKRLLLASRTSIFPFRLSTPPTVSVPPCMIFAVRCPVLTKSATISPSCVIAVS